MILSLSPVNNVTLAFLLLISNRIDFHVVSSVQVGRDDVVCGLQTTLDASNFSGAHL